MGDKVSARRLTGMGFAALALCVATAGAAVLIEGPAHAAADADAPAGRQIFIDWSCGACHSLKDAGGTGHVGPEFDGAKLAKEFVVGRITNGQGAMPSFGGQLTKAEIDELGTYISAESNK